MGKIAKKGEVVASASGLIVGTGKRNGSKFQWKSVIFGAVVILAALVAGGTARLVQTRHNRPASLQPSAAQQKADSIQGLALSGDYTAAQKQLIQALNNPKLTKDERASLLSVQASTFENQQQYQQALDIFRRVDMLRPTQGSAQAVGRVAEEVGNKSAAIAAYRIAITRVDKNSPIADTDIVRYKHLIANLSGQP